MFAALGQTPPPEAVRADARGGRGGGRGGNAQTAAPPSLAAPQGDQPSGRRDTGSPVGRGATQSDSKKDNRRQDQGSREPQPGESTRTLRQAQGVPSEPQRGESGSSSADRMQTMTPEQRDRFMQRMRERGASPSSDGSLGFRSGGAGAAAEAGPARGQRGGAAETPSIVSQNPHATTIDALFGPLPPTESVGRVWLYVDKQLKPVRVRLGISDGQATELIEGDLKAGDPVVTNVLTGNETTRPAAGAFPPFMGQPQRGGFPGGGGFRGGAGGGGRGR
jgi:hypothetical protein